MSRLFLALTLSEPMQQSVLSWSQKYAELPVRWVAGRNLHITLVPPWQEHNLSVPLRKLQEVTQSEPITLKFDQVSLGPQSHSPRLIWAAGPTPQILLNLKQKLENVLHMPPTPRAFKLHLTLARFKQSDYAQFPFRTFNELVAWQDTVTDFALMESKLLPQGADYKVVQRFLL